MSVNKLPVGSFVRIDKSELQTIFDALRRQGYVTVAPTLRDAAIVYDEVDSLEQLPAGYVDEQDGGRYRLQRDETAGFFDYVVGPQSLKRFLFPPRTTVLEGHRANGKWVMAPAPTEAVALAVIGPRSCDLRALALQDRVFLEGGFVDPAYKSRRERLFIAAVNCRRSAATCFCHSMKTGPACASGFDLAITEFRDDFVLEVGTARGGAIATTADWTPCTLDRVHESQAISKRLEQTMNQQSTRRRPGDGAPRGRHLDTTEIRDLLIDSLQHARWDEVARRCLACGNCTLVCPTCFCSSVEELTDLTGDQVRRERTWASCFTEEHSYMSSGTVRKTIAARYRQWLTHKLATWWDQFGASGCVGCGRCITWCPVGIDLTEEVAAIRGVQP